MNGDGLFTGIGREHSKRADIHCDAIDPRPQFHYIRLGKSHRDRPQNVQVLPGLFSTTVPRIMASRRIYTPRIDPSVYEATENWTARCVDPSYAHKLGTSIHIFSIALTHIRLPGIGPKMVSPSTRSSADPP